MNMRARMPAVFLIIVLCLPLHGVVNAQSSSPAQDEQESPNLPRVYGENHALDVFYGVSYSGYRDFVREFTENGSRWALDASDTSTGNNLKARKYLLHKMVELSNGRIETEVVGEHNNVVGKLPGYLPGNNPALIISGHYDSWYVSIGANEGGSGIATVLSLIEPLSAFEWPLDIYFIALNSRYAQWGPFGGAEIATYFFNNQVDILAMYCVEALLVENPVALPDERVFMAYLNLGLQNYHISQYWADLGRVMSNNYGRNMIKPVPNGDLSFYDSRWYEHNVLIDRGYMSMIVPFESGADYDYDYRTPEDTWVNPVYRYQSGAEVTASIGASIAYTMSREYGQPMEHDLSIEIDIGRSKTYYIPISTPTTINVTSRWFGGTSSFTLLDPDLNILAFNDYNRTSAWETTDVFSQPVAKKGIYRLIIENTGTSNVGYQLHYAYDSDIDGNNVLDSKEYWLDTTLFEQDSDLDTISDALEIIYGTDIHNQDTDSDSMPDNYEIEQGFDPRDPSDAFADADGDSISNAEEYILGLNPWSQDSDFDEIPDGWELAHGLNPLVNDAQGDLDNDGKSNLEEFMDGTDPQLAERAVVKIHWFVIPAILGIAFVTMLAILMHLESRIVD